MEDMVVVTGASRGIGAAIAHSLAKGGLTVGCLSRSGALPELPDTPQDLRSRWVAASCDVTDVVSVTDALCSLIGQGHRLVGLVNNAGVHIEGKSAEVSLQDWHKVMDTNATSVVTTSQAAYPYLVEAGGGLIVNIGSFFDKMGVKRNLAYCASKAAVGAITRCLAVEWASKAIRVVDVAPGYILTDLNRESLSNGPLRAYLEKRIPAGNPGSAEDVADVVRMLFQTTGKFLTGETIYVDGAQGINH